LAAVDALRGAAVGYRAAVAHASELEAALDDLRKRYAVLTRCSASGSDAAVQATAGAESQADAVEGPFASFAAAAAVAAPSSSAVERPVKRPRPSPQFDTSVAVDAEELARLRAKVGELGGELDDARFANEILLDHVRHA